MTKSFAITDRAVNSRPLAWHTWAAMVAVPLLIMGLLTWAFWSPATNHGTAQAAVVNNDEPVKVQGQTIPLGRTLAGDLTHDEASAYTWVLTDEDDARDGLDDGTYAAVVTIPKDFSARATSSATEDDPLEALRASLEIDTGTAAGASDPYIAQNIVKDAQRTLNQTIVTTYLENVYDGFNTMHDQLADAADGAATLADGTSKLSDGADEVADGSDELADGASALADGSAQLAQGTGELASGLTTAADETAQLPAATRQLATGADKVADGNEQLAGQVVPLANKAITGIDGLPDARAVAAEMRRLADRCSTQNPSDPDFCADLDRAADRAAAEAERLEQGKSKVRANVVDARDSVQALASGARKVADGNAELARRSTDLAAGIASAASGAREVDNGAQQLAGGARELAGGADELSSGARNLAAGARDVDDGAQKLATGLADAVEQVPTYTDKEKSHLARIVANPSSAKVDGSPFGVLSITLLAALALWALALVTYIATRPLPAGLLTSRTPTWRIILRSTVPGTIAAASAAAIITVIALPVLDLGASRAFGFLLVALLAAGTFVSLNQALAAIFGTVGRLVSLAVVVLTLATGVITSLPAPLYAVASLLPTHGAVVALRALATGGAGLTTGIVELAAWFAVGLLAAILVTDRRRYVSPRALRLQPVQAPAADIQPT